MDKTLLEMFNTTRLAAKYNYSQGPKQVSITTLAPLQMAPVTHTLNMCSQYPKQTGSRICPLSVMISSTKSSQSTISHVNISANYKTHSLVASPSWRSIPLKSLPMHIRQQNNWFCYTSNYVMDTRILI